LIEIQISKIDKMLHQRQDQLGPTAEKRVRFSWSEITKEHANHINLASIL